MKKIFLCVAILVLSGCADRFTMAPVVGSNWKAYSHRGGRYVVQRGDTLYSIAFRYDRDYRKLASLNHLPHPYILSIGQVLLLDSPQSWRFQKSVKHSTLKMTPSKRLVSQFLTRWMWPAHGRIATTFNPQAGKKGIDIAGQKGNKIYASRSGVVAYAGNGLAGYGNLIILRHDNQWLTAYGYNARNLVLEGQQVKAGQVIAEMGIVEHRFYGVHFEIRQAGHPINPLNYL